MDRGGRRSYMNRGLGKSCIDREESKSYMDSGYGKSSISREQNGLCIDREQTGYAWTEGKPDYIRARQKAREVVNLKRAW